jgi:hypothetical protein
VIPLHYGKCTDHVHPEGCLFVFLLPIEGFHCYYNFLILSDLKRSLKDEPLVEIGNLQLILGGEMGILCDGGEAGSGKLISDLWAKL